MLGVPCCLHQGTRLLGAELDDGSIHQVDLGRMQGAAVSQGKEKARQEGEDCTVTSLKKSTQLAASHSLVSSPGGTRTAVAMSPLYSKANV